MENGLVTRYQKSFNACKGYSNNNKPLVMALSKNVTESVLLQMELQENIEAQKLLKVLFENTTSHLVTLPIINYF